MKTAQLPDVDWCKLFGELMEAVDHAGFVVERDPRGFVYLVRRVKVSATTQRLIELLIERDQAGLAKYGTTLDRTDLSHTEWLQHMTEEALDAAGYAQAAIRTYQERGK